MKSIIHMSLSDFFAKQRAKWKADTKARSEDYALGGTVALRDAEAALALEQRTQPNATELQRQLKAMTAERDESNRRNKVLRKQLDTTVANMETLAALKNPVHEGKPWETTRALEHKQQKGLQEMLTECKQNRARLENENQSLRLLAFGPSETRFNYRKAFKRLTYHAGNPELPPDERLAMVVLTLENYLQVINGDKPAESETRKSPTY